MPDETLPPLPSETYAPSTGTYEDDLPYDMKVENWTKDFFQKKMDVTLTGLTKLINNKMSRHSNSFIQSFLYEAIRQQRLDVVKTLLQLSLVTPVFLNTEHVSFTEGSDIVSYLYCAVIQEVSVKRPLSTKLDIVHTLLDAGATNVNVGYYFFGVSGATPFTAVCCPGLWPNIDENMHRDLLRRMYGLGGKPHFRLQPLAPSAYELAEKNAPYLLDILPDNEQNDGQLTLIPVPKMETDRANAIGKVFSKKFAESGSLFE